MLTQLKDSMGLQHEISTSLDSKLNASLASIEAGDYGAAADQLESFVNEVNAQTGQHITRPRRRPDRGCRLRTISLSAPLLLLNDFLSNQGYTAHVFLRRSRMDRALGGGFCSAAAGQQFAIHPESDQLDQCVRISPLVREQPLL